MIFKKVMKNYQNVMEPEEFKFVNKTMVEFCGRFLFRQCIPEKVHKYDD